MKFVILVLASFLTVALAIPVPEAEAGIPQVDGRQPIDNPPPIVDDDAFAELQFRKPRFNRWPTSRCVCVRSPCPCDSPPWGK